VQGQTVWCGRRADLLRASTPRRSADGRSCIRALTPTPVQTPGSGGNPCTTSQDATQTSAPSGTAMRRLPRMADCRVQLSLLPVGSTVRAWRAHGSCSGDVGVIRRGCFCLGAAQGSVGRG
jgi:hypothetical protein